jgi:hypothetical protein
MKRLGPCRSLDLRFSIRAHRSPADVIDTSMADLSCNASDADDSLTVRRSRYTDFDPADALVELTNDAVAPDGFGINVV